MHDYSNTAEGKAYLAEKRQRDIEAAVARARSHFRSRYPALQDKRYSEMVDRETAKHDWESLSPEKQIELLDAIAQQALEKQQSTTRRRTARDLIANRQRLQRPSK